MNLRILIVEDSDIILDDLEELLQGLKQTRAEADDINIEEIEVGKAKCISTAESMLLRAVNRQSPYDILLLDLSLPKTVGAVDNFQGGLELMRRVREWRAARQIIIVSANSDLVKHVTEAFKRGAVGFIRKPYSEEEVQQQILNVVGLLKEEYLSRLRKLLDERIPTLSASLWKSMAYQFSGDVYDLAQLVSDKTEELTAGLQDRFGIDPADEPLDPLLVHLNDIRQYLTRTVEKLAKAQTLSKDATTVPEEIVLEQALPQLKQELWPCLALHLAPSSGHETRVLSFQQNVQTVLKEILIGGLSEAENSTRTWNAKIEIKEQKGMVALQIGDDFPPLNAAQTEWINQGGSIFPQTSDRREWGLALAQHIALRGGGRLELEPQEMGNRITYWIPLA